MHHKDFIFFDLDGTLTNPSIGITNGVREGLACFGIEEPDRTVLYPFIGPPLLESFRNFYHMTEQQAETAVKAFRRFYAEKGLYENEVYPGIPELLADLCRANKKVVLATSKPELFSIQILEHFGLKDYFYQFGAASMDESRSEKTDVIRHALSLCGNPDPESIVMVGDRKHDILGAKANGLESIGVLYGFGDRHELEKAGADRIADTVENLHNILLHL